MNRHEWQNNAENVLIVCGLPSIVIAVIFFVLSCSGGDDQVLHLATGDETEGQFRAEVRAELANPIQRQVLCGVEGLSVEDAETYLLNVNNRTILGGIGTPVRTVQATSPLDKDTMRRFIEILQEECGR